jgi:hypothetical protein
VHVDDFSRTKSAIDEVEDLNHEIRAWRKPEIGDAQGSPPGLATGSGRQQVLVGGEMVGRRRQVDGASQACSDKSLEFSPGFGFVLGARILAREEEAGDHPVGVGEGYQDISGGIPSNDLCYVSPYINAICSQPAKVPCFVVALGRTATSRREAKSLDAFLYFGRMLDSSAAAAKLRYPVPGSRPEPGSLPL